MAILYVNLKGEAWQKHSYSAGNDYDQCPYKYYLKRVMGWKERDDKGAFAFGRALEKAIEYHHDNGGKGGVEKFAELWAPAAALNLTYTKTEKDWASLNKAGNEMMRLYLIRQPSLPIPLGGGSVFQREYGKEVFPGDENYGEIMDAGKLDIVCYVDPAHPLLAKIHWKPEYGLLRPLIVDIKTSGKDFPENPGIAAFDKQLRRYSWQSGIRDVALLWFKKAGHTMKKGISVTLLEDAGNFKAGDEAVVAKFDEKENTLWLLANDFMMTAMDDAQGRKADKSVDQTAAAKARRDDWLKENGTAVTPEDVTRQRLQFNSGFVSIESANDAGHIAARQIQNIVNSWKDKSWPQTFGIRFPTDDRNDPYFRAFVAGEEAFKKENFKQVDPKEFDDFFEDEPEEDGE